MNIIFVGQKHGQSRAFTLTPITLSLLGLIFTALLVLAAWSGYRLAVPAVVSADDVPSSALIAAWQQRLADQQDELVYLREKTNHHVDALTLRLGEMQARMLRLDALGQRFIESGVLGNDEFNFDSRPALGGPEDAGLPGESFSVPELTSMIAQFDRTLSDRERQLRLLDELLSRERIETERFVTGRPVTWGWVSSRYGYRTDPFSGRRTWHNGVDIAGREGGDVIAVAAGVVTFAGRRGGYGKLVEIDHGDGLVTRYAHHKSIEVEAGDVVQRGQLIAHMGSTGRSTGPHVHFEVLLNGRSQDPEQYMQRARR